MKCLSVAESCPCNGTGRGEAGNRLKQVVLEELGSKPTKHIQLIIVILKYAYEISIALY